jgi:hypothetical protein
MDDSNDSKNSAASGWCFVLVVLNIVIVVHTTRDLFSQIFPSPHGEWFYVFHEYMLGCAGAVWGSLLLASWLSCCAFMSDRDPSSLMMLPLVALLVTVILQYWQMGRLWHTYPKHLIFFYSEYWTESLCHFSDALPSLPHNMTMLLNTSGKIIAERRLEETLATVSHWPYVMSDVVVRFYSFALMILPVILGASLSCVGSATACGWLCDKVCGGQKPREHSAF